MGRDGNDFPRPRVRIYALDRMRGIEAKRDNAEKKKAKVGEGEGEVWWLGGGFQSTINEARPCWIKGPTKRDRSRFAVLTEPIGSGSRNPGDRDGICNAKQGTAGATGAADETGAHTPYVLFHRRTRPPCRATTHGYVRLFRYADDPSSERARGRRGGEKMEWDASPSVFLLGSRDEST